MRIHEPLSGGRRAWNGFFWEYFSRFSSQNIENENVKTKKPLQGHFSGCECQEKCFVLVNTLHRFFSAIAKLSQARAARNIKNLDNNWKNKLKPANSKTQLHFRNHFEVVYTELAKRFLKSLESNHKPSAAHRPLCDFDWLICFSILARTRVATATSRWRRTTSTSKPMTLRFGITSSTGYRKPSRAIPENILKLHHFLKSTFE